ncbi:MAG: C-GCAxxG-C-C family protein [Oscillospiraceae bacterium]|nr:C-GCAxxG-C-C family protein [Oscillospiraceae bacterium]
MTKQEKIDLAVETARQAQIRDDICARSVLLGLATFCDRITEDMITASTSLAGGSGAAGGSCGAYCCGQLAVGMYKNRPLSEELRDRSLQETAYKNFTTYRDRFKEEFGSVLCPDVHKKLFGRSYILSDPQQEEEFLHLEGHVEKCAEAVAAATRIAAEMILEDEE